MSQKKLIESSYCPNPSQLEVISVKIECVNEKNEVLNNGTGTLFSNSGSYYVLTAAHCIQLDDTANHCDKTNIRVSLPRFNTPAMEVGDVLIFYPKDKIDFALLSVKIDTDNFPVDFDYENGIRFISKDEFSTNTCLYAYTSTEPEGRMFKIHMVSSDTYAIDDDISASGADISNVMKGSSGSGIFVGYDEWICCLGYVKSRKIESNKLDDIKIFRIPKEINDKLAYPILLPTIQKNPPTGRVAISKSCIDIEYINKWENLDQVLSQNEDANKLLDDIVSLRKQIPYVKSVVNQEGVINVLLRKRVQWSANEQRAFIYALQDRGLWPTLFGELQKAGDLSVIPEMKNMMLRASTFDCGMNDGQYVLDHNTDEGTYELILREAYKFEFDNMYKRVVAWEPSGAWVIKKALLISLFKQDEDSLVLVKKYIDNKSNPATERFVASLIYNVISDKFPQPCEYTEFWNDGVDGPSEIISYIANRIDKNKKQPKIFGVHSTLITSSKDSISFPESIRFLQYLINAGLTTKFGIYVIVDIEYWMRVFRHLIHFIPYPAVYYTLQYTDEKTLRWAGQMIAYSDDDFLTDIRPNLLLALLKAMRMKHVPKKLHSGLLNLTQELYMSVSEDVWYDEFTQSVLDHFVNDIDMISSYDAIYRNLFSAIQCVKNQERRKEIFVKLTGILPQNVHLISKLFCNALWVDADFAAMDEVSECLWKIINENSISQSYNVLCEFNRVNALTQEQKDAIDKKIAEENLLFSKKDYLSLIYLSHLAKSDDSISKIKRIALAGDMWNCGITKSHYSNPSPFHIEKFDDKVVWTENEWQQIKANMIQNLNLIETSSVPSMLTNFFNCTYIDILSDMKLFMASLRLASGFDVDDVIKRVDTDINKLSGFDNLMEALSSDDYNMVDVALNLLNVKLITDGFDKCKPEISLIISKVALMQSGDIDNCIKFIVLKSAVI